MTNQPRFHSPPPAVELRCEVTTLTRRSFSERRERGSLRVADRRPDVLPELPQSRRIDEVRLDGRASDGHALLPGSDTDRGSRAMVGQRCPEDPYARPEHGGELGDDVFERELRPIGRVRER
jgi:hypothetical protein